MSDGMTAADLRSLVGDIRGRLGSDPAVVVLISEVAEVKVAKLPLDINPTLSLSGNTTENRDQIGKAEFKLVIILKPTL
jgi:hypothetical protein